MRTSDFVLLLLDAWGGSTSGRTLLQKRAYFVSILRKESLAPVDFDAHYYGPYSAAIDASVGELKSMGFLDEAAMEFGTFGPSGFEIKRYDYRLTDDGRKVADSLKRTHKHESEVIRETVQRIREAGDPDYSRLSVAAKAYFILAKKGLAMDRAQILRQAKSFAWNIDDESLEKAVAFLEALGLVTQQTKQAEEAASRPLPLVPPAFM